MNPVSGMNLYASSDVEELFPWFAIMFGILVAALVIMLLKTRRH